MAIDFNSAPEQRSFDLIPDGTVVTVQTKIRPGNAGPDGMLRRTNNGDAEMLDFEFTVFGGKYDKRKFWDLLVVSGTTDGHAQAANISLGKLRAIVESARGIKPNDVSEAAKAARTLSGYEEVDGLRFIAKVGVEPARGEYKAKNFLARVVTPDEKDWHQVEQVAAKPAEAAPATNVIVKPAWAQ